MLSMGSASTVHIKVGLFGPRFLIIPSEVGNKEGKTQVVWSNMKFYYTGLNGETLYLKLDLKLMLNSISSAVSFCH